jgi:uncharacterized membrane protein
LSVIFVGANHLTGLASEEITYLIDAAKNPLDYKDLLLAGMFIGILGILDDIVMGQNEQVATEIVRTLVGVAGICSAIPISTWLAVKYLEVTPELVEEEKDLHG